MSLFISSYPHNRNINIDGQSIQLPFNAYLWLPLDYLFFSSAFRLRQLFNRAFFLNKKSLIKLMMVACVLLFILSLYRLILYHLVWT